MRPAEIILKISLGLLTASLVLACASQKVMKKEIVEENPPDFNRGMKALNAEDFGAAAELFDHLLVAKPATELDLVTSFNSGAAHEGLGDCKEAAERYREVVRSSAGKFARLEAQALFRLSLMYECLGEDTKTVTALLDARKRSRELPVEISRAELPARLAAAYSRLGNRAKALQYFRQASDGLKLLLAQSGNSNKAKETFGRTLYFMGRLNASQKNADGDPIRYLQSLSMQQPYLLQAIEVAPPEWVRKANDDLLTAYDNILRFSLKNPARQHEFYIRALQVIAELRKIRMPDAGPQEDSIFTNVDKTERQIRDRLSVVPSQNPLTNEALKRDGLKREGRLVTPRPAPRPAPKTQSGRRKK